MKIYNLLYIFSLSLVFALLFGCGPKSITTDDQYLKETSREWIPFAGTETVVFNYDTSKMVFTGQGLNSYFDNVLYMTDQSGFFAVEKDYYANLERELLIFESPSTSYFIKYYLETSKGDVGEWDIFKVIMADGDFYKNEIKIVVYQTDSYNKGENYKYKNKITLNSIQFDSVYYWKQENRPFEIYYTKKQGIVAFKLSSQEIWTLSQDTLQ